MKRVILFVFFAILISSVGLVALNFARGVYLHDVLMNRSVLALKTIHGALVQYSGKPKDRSIRWPTSLQTLVDEGFLQASDLTFPAGVSLEYFPPSKAGPHEVILAARHREFLATCTVAGDVSTKRNRGLEHILRNGKRDGESSSASR